MNTAARTLSRKRFSTAFVVSAALVILLAALLMGSARADTSIGAGGTLNARWKTDPDATTSVPVSFSFHREEQGAGRITVQLGPGGKRYAGSYLRLTGKRSPARVRVFYSYFVSDAFDDNRNGPGGAPMDRKQITIEQFQSRYTGSVVATLIGGGGGGMRCVFELLDSTGGLADGATGRCQLEDGGVIELTPPARR